MEGLIHISDSAVTVWPTCRCGAGRSRVWVKILKVDPEGRKIGLSLKAFQEEGGLHLRPQRTPGL